MNALTSALQVLIKSVWYKCFGWPTIMLGIDSNGDPQPFGVSTPSGGGGGGIPITPPSGTFSIFAKTAGQTETIPIGAFNIGIIFLTGTGTVGGVDLPVNVSLNIDAKTAAEIAVVCGSPGTARVSYLV